jgi:hypothetical protein
MADFYSARSRIMPPHHAPPLIFQTIFQSFQPVPPLWGARIN